MKRHLLLLLISYLSMSLPSYSADTSDSSDHAGLSLVEHEIELSDEESFALLMENSELRNEYFLSLLSRFEHFEDTDIYSSKDQTKNYFENLNSLIVYLTLCDEEFTDAEFQGFDESVDEATAQKLKDIADDYNRKLTELGHCPTDADRWFPALSRGEQAESLLYHGAQIESFLYWLPDALAAVPRGEAAFPYIGHRVIPMFLATSWLTFRMQVAPRLGEIWHRNAMREYRSKKDTLDSRKAEGEKLVMKNFHGEKVAKYKTQLLDSKYCSMPPLGKEIGKSFQSLSAPTEIHQNLLKSFRCNERAYSELVDFLIQSMHGAVLRHHEKNIDTFSNISKKIRKVLLDYRGDTEEICCCCREHLGFQEQEIALLDNCAHTFHSACIKQWFKGDSGRCPLCKKESPI